MVPFKVTWRFRKPVCLSERPLHLDALLAFVAVDRAGIVDPSTALSAQEHLPLEKHAVGTSWVWKASQVLFTPAAPIQIVPMIRRTDIPSMAFHQGTVFRGTSQGANLGTGQEKAYDLRIAVQWMERAEAFGIGDIDAVREALSSLGYIGRLTRNGWGEVCDVAVSPDAEASTHWRKRTLPSSFDELILDSHVPSTGTVHPPYWKRENAQEVFEFVN